MTTLRAHPHHARPGRSGAEQWQGRLLPWFFVSQFRYNRLGRTGPDSQAADDS